MQLDRAWDVAMVAEALVRAYELLDGAPVLSSGNGYVVAEKRVGARSLAAWIGMRRYVTDPDDLKILRTWCSCKARGASVKARFEDSRWHPKTADRHRRAALSMIAAGLNAERAMAASLQS